MSRLDLDAANWAELSRLLDQALDLPPDDRAAWLGGLGAEVQHLLPQLRVLLSRAAEVETGDFLNTMPKVGAAIPVLSGGQQAGDLIGGYRLVRELGRGGMGAVWLAERADGLINRPIALKLPHLAGERAGLAERMAREREILAALDHRNIARLLDAGVSPDGQPFLALEYVEGVTISARCARADGEPLPLAARLGLFRQVADAVAYAHGKLIIHRDLKPANILVTADGGVRLLDFGIAKLLDHGETRETRLTEISGRALTPDYASPEQILGEPLTVASDVYSLGVILYELLTEARPYRLKRDSRGALEDAILESDAPRPSDVAPVQRRKALRGDLDTIALKALKKNPSERYATVNALAEDVARYLEQRPVLAQPDSRWYRLRKFIARNKLGVAAGALVVAALVAGAGVALWQAQQARSEQARAESVNRLLTRMFENADPGSAGGKPLSAAQLLVTATREFESQTIADPRVRAEMSNTLATSLFRLGEDAESEKLTERALKDMQKQLPAGDVRTLRAHILRAEQLRYRGNTKEARAHLDATAPWVSVLREQQPQEYVNRLLVDADIAIDDSEYDRAIELSKQAYAEALRRFGRVHQTTAYALTKISTSYHFADRNREALTAARDALDLTRELFRKQPLAPGLMDARVSYANALGATQEYAQAVDAFDGVIRDAGVVYGKDSVEVALYLQNAAGYMLRAGRIKEGIEAAGRALAIRGPQIEAASFQSLAIRNVYSRALLYGRRSNEASVILAGMQADARKVLGAGHPRELGVRASYALALAWSGRDAEAAAIADEVLRAARDKGKPAGYLPLHVGAQLARLARDGATAVALETEALKIEDLEPNERAEALAELGAAAMLQQDTALAERSLAEAIEVLDGIGNRATPLRAEIELHLAKLHFERRESDVALRLAEGADRFWREFDPQNRGAGEAAYWLGRIQSSAGDAAAARANVSRGAAILAKSPRRADRQLALDVLSP